MDNDNLEDEENQKFEEDNEMVNIFLISNLLFIIK